MVSVPLAAAVLKHNLARTEDVDDDLSHLQYRSTLQTLGKVFADEGFLALYKVGLLHDCLPLCVRNLFLRVFFIEIFLFLTIQVDIAGPNIFLFSIQPFRFPCSDPIVDNKLFLVQGLLPVLLGSAPEMAVQVGACIV